MNTHHDHIQQHRPRRPRIATIITLCIAAAVLAAGCGEKDPGALGPEGIDGLSGETRAQDYVEGVGRNLEGMRAATNSPAFSRAIDTGNKRQLQVQSLAWDEGVSGLQQLDPPKDAVPAHKRLVAATTGLSRWNERLIAAAPNKKRVQGLARQAANSPESKAYAAAICELVDLGYNVVPEEQASGCGPLDAPGAVGGDAGATG